MTVNEEGNPTSRTCADFQVVSVRFWLCQYKMNDDRNVNEISSNLIIVIVAGIDAHQ